MGRGKEYFPDAKPSERGLPFFWSLGSLGPGIQCMASNSKNSERLGLSTCGYSQESCLHWEQVDLPRMAGHRYVTPMDTVATWEQQASSF